MAMIDNYEHIMAQWGCGCNATMTVTPEEDMTRWSVQRTVTILANADYYYTKEEVDKIIENIVKEGGMTEDEVIALIEQYTSGKADKTDVDELADKVRENAEKILSTNNLLKDYLTKIEGRAMVANYAKVDGETLSLNNEQITIN